MSLFLVPHIPLLQQCRAAIAAIPVGSSVGGEDSLPALRPEEFAFAESLPLRRGREWTAGRRALRRALCLAGLEAPGPLLPDDHGRPRLDPGWTASVSHKQDLAVAVAAPSADGGTLGVDLEDRGHPRPGIAKRILRPDEIRRWEAEGSRWEDLLEIFSVKEAIYKAIHPFLLRFVGFDEAEIDGVGAARFFPRSSEPELRLEVAHCWVGERLVSVASCAGPLPPGHRHSGLG